jgi:hypothetical protein
MRKLLEVRGIADIEEYNLMIFREQETDRKCILGQF